MNNISTNRIEILKKYLDEDPRDNFSSYALSLEYAGQSKIPEAIFLLEQLLSRDPGYLAAYYQLGKLLELNGKIPGAVSVYKAGLEVAQKQKDQKTYNELQSALDVLEE